MLFERPASSITFVSCQHSFSAVEGTTKIVSVPSLYSFRDVSGSGFAHVA